MVVTSSTSASGSSARTCSRTAPAEGQGVAGGADHEVMEDAGACP